LISERLLILVVGAILVVGFVGFLRFSRWGKAMRATLQNREAAMLIGIPVHGVTRLSFAVAGGLAAAAGALVGTVVPIDPFVGDNVLLKGFIVLVVGGTTSPLGVIATSLLLGVAEALGAGYVSASTPDAFGFALLVIVLLAKPSGLFAERSIGRV
jgi:branched-chain amino acid transport system permease protein